MSRSDVAAATGQPEPAFYRMADVLRITALSRSSLYRRIASGDFPAPVSLGGRAKGWRRAALLEWIEDPVGYRPLTHCVKNTGSAGGRVRRVAAATSQPST
ncbi:helix-turn-helix transcriptional regulator [Advenella faeciporci]|uniref:helix-turn-helix transcriptional regulator n=1 Tax=Advenella faeciporci TaxID=797535 RepID=UPI001677E99B|nr:AlpA family phage regulatory protein [Advenella faeciporci]